MARQWLVKFCALTGKPAEPVLFSLWSEHLADIPPDRLNAACGALMKTWRYPNLPLPGDVRAQLDGVDENALELEAGEEWNRALRFTMECWHPDIGFYQNVPELSPATWHALKAAGGMRYVYTASREELQWARKRFVSNYTLVHETGKAEHLLGDCEARRILDKIANPPKKQLAAPKVIDPPEPTEKPSRAEVRAALDRISADPAIEMSEAEFEQRKAREQKALAEWIAQHPEARTDVSAQEQQI